MYRSLVERLVNLSLPGDEVEAPESESPLTVTEVFRRSCEFDADAAWTSLTVTTMGHFYFDMVDPETITGSPEPVMVPRRRGPSVPKPPSKADLLMDEVFEVVFETEGDLEGEEVLPAPRPAPTPVPPPPLEWFLEPPGEKPVFRRPAPEKDVVHITLTWVARVLQMPIPIAAVLRETPMRSLKAVDAMRLRDDLIEDREGIIEWAKDLWEVSKSA